MNAGRFTRTGFRVGSAKYTDGGEVGVGRYAGRAVALALLGDAEVEAVATVNLTEHPLPFGYVWLKSWGENEGIPEAFAAAGAVELTGIAKDVGRGTAFHARILEPVLDRIPRAFLVVRSIADGAIVRRVAVYDIGEKRVDRIMTAMLAQMDTDSFFVDDSDVEAAREAGVS